MDQGVMAARFGGPMATYTAVLPGVTAVPSWPDMREELAFTFAASAMTAGGGLTMVCTPVGGGPVTEDGGDRRGDRAGRDTPG
jgi:hypothetical protein